MKRLLQLLFIAIIFTNCSDEFSLINDEVNLAEDWEELFIVYANISPSDEFHYIRVNRGYSAENFTAGEGEMDSIQYGIGELDVRFYVIENEDTIKTYTCRDTIIEKDSGDFFNTGQVLLHYFNEPELVSGNAENFKFGLSVTNGTTTASSTTSAIGSLTFKYPPATPYFSAVEFEGSLYRVEVNQPINSQAFEVIGVGRYREIREIAGVQDTIPQTFIFNVGRKVVSDPLQSADVLGFLGDCGGFYDAIGAHVRKYGDTVNTVRRRFDGVYFKAIAGNSDLAVSTLSGVNTGFHDNLTTYGNINNGLGLFSAYNSGKTRSYDVTRASMDKIIDLYGTKYLFTR